jgi:hypothetical protein
MAELHRPFRSISIGFIVYFSRICHVSIILIDVTEYCMPKSTRNKNLEVKKKSGSSSSARRRKHLSRIVTVDLDGTVADIGKRRELALTFGPEKSPSFYEALLDPSLFHLDYPIEGARDFLNNYRLATGGEVVYLSGRRVGTEAASLEWLVQHGFPSGQVLHRKTGIKSMDFKKQCLEVLSNEFAIDGHFGDREIDDRQSAGNAGIVYYHIDNYQWPIFAHVRDAFIKPTPCDYQDL